VPLINVATKGALTDASHWFYDSVHDFVYIFGDPSGDTLQIVVKGWTNEGEPNPLANRFYITGIVSTPAGIIRNGVPLTFVASPPGDLTPEDALTNAGQWLYDSVRQRVYVFGDPTADSPQLVAVGYRFGQDIDTDPELTGSASTKDPLSVSVDKAIAVVSEAEAEISIGDGASLHATHDVMLHATGISSSVVTTTRAGWGITYGSS